MRYLLDTNICIYLINKRPAGVIDRLRTAGIGQVALSSISVSELYYGAHKSPRRAHNLDRLAEFFVPFEIVSFDHEAALSYGRLRAALEKKGQLIGPLDMLIAAQALSAELVLVTNNSREFERVPGLTVENWAV